MLTLDEVNKLIEELMSIKVDPNTNPFEIGIPDFVKKLNEYKAKLDRVNHILLIAMKNQAEANSKYGIMKSQFEQKVNALLITDDEVKKEKSAESRRAAAHIRLNEDLIKLTAAEQDLLLMTSLSNLAKRVYANLKLLVSLMAEERAMFHMSLYLEGKLNSSPTFPNKKMDDFDLKDTEISIDPEKE